MTAVVTVLISVGIVAIWDWLGVMRIGSFAESFDYRYWPFSKLRLASVALLMVSVAISALFAHPNPNNPPLWPLLVVGPALAIWAFVAWFDFMAQRRAGYREPPRYSDRD